MLGDMCCVLPRKRGDRGHSCDPAFEPWSDMTAVVAAVADRGGPVRGKLWSGRGRRPWLQPATGNREIFANFIRLFPEKNDKG
jgi:hypothetical protein